MREIAAIRSGRLGEALAEVHSRPRLGLVIFAAVMLAVIGYGSRENMGAA